MAKRTYINGDPQKLKQFLDESGYFDSVTIESGASTAKRNYKRLVVCKTGDATLRIGNVNTSNYDDAFSVEYENANGIYDSWYGFNSDASSNANESARTELKPTYGYQCSGGLAVIMNATRMIISKNNHGEVVVALTTYGVNTGGRETVLLSNTVKQITAYAPSDMLPIVRYNTNTIIGTQTLLIPICTSAAYGQISYTTTAFWMTCKQFDTVGNFMYNGKRYFSDGYFAIEDSETEAV